MKAYFTASILEKNQHPELNNWYKAIVTVLEKLNVQLDKRNVNTDPGKLLKETEEDIIEAFNYNNQKLKQADIVVAEVSYHDSGVGYEIASALANKKPVIALFNESVKVPPSTPILGMGKKSKSLTFIKYNLDDLEKKLAGAIDNARKKLDSKFILIISPEIDKYLEWASGAKRMHKAQIVREAIEDNMKKDKNWKTKNNE